MYHAYRNGPNCTAWMRRITDYLWVLKFIETKPGYRHKGLASKVLQEIDKDADTEGVILLSHDINPTVRRWHLAHGWQAIGKFYVYRYPGGGEMPRDHPMWRYITGLVGLLC